jgi:hypothetical protein
VPPHIGEGLFSAILIIFIGAVDFVESADSTENPLRSLALAVSCNCRIIRVMEIEINKSVFIEILRNHHLDFEESEGIVSLKKSEAGKTKVSNTKTLYGIGIIVLGLVLIFKVSVRGGLGIIAAGVLLLSRLINLNSREEETLNKSVDIKGDEILIRENYKVRKIKIEDIKEFKTRVYEIKPRYVGKIILLTETDHAYELLELYGKDENELERDLVIISSYLVEEYINKE